MKIILFLDVSMSRNNIVLDTGQSSLFLDCPVQSWTPGHPDKTPLVNKNIIAPYFIVID